MAKLTLKMNNKETIVITCGDGRKIKINCHPSQHSIQGKEIVIDAPEEFDIGRVPNVTRLIEGS